MVRKLLTAILALLLAFLFSAGQQISLGTSTIGTSKDARQKTLQQTALTNQAGEEKETDTQTTKITPSKQLDIGNHISNGSFGIGTDGFSTSNSTMTYSATTGSDGNVYSSVLFNQTYSKFFSVQTSLEANTTYTFSFDYYITSDNPNMYACGLSTIAGHPNTDQAISPSGTAPYTITNLSTNTVVRSNTSNTSLIMYGVGARTLAIDGANRTASIDYGAWMRFSTTFTLSSAAPSVYFYFMSYEQGKQADGITPLAYNTTKTICFDNIAIKGLYDVSVSAGTGGKASKSILDTSGYTGKVYESGRVQYTATPAYQNEFAGWIDDDNNIVSTNPSYTARPSGNTHLTATFTSHNGIGTYGAEYSTSDESTDFSTNTSSSIISNTSGITSLGSYHTSITGTAVGQSYRFSQSSLTANSNYVLSFYLYGTETTSFGLYSDTSTTPLLSGSNVATLNKYSVTTSGETSLGSSQLASTVYTTVSGDLNGWVHYIVSFTTSDTSTTYFSLAVPSTTALYLLDNVSLTKSSNITILPATSGGTISCFQFGGTISTSTTKSLLNGTYITVTATPDNGKGFVAWLDNRGSPVSYNKNYSFYVNGVQSLKPLFDTGNKVYNGDFSLNTTGWTAYGESASNPNISVLDTVGLQSENIPETPTGHSALKLSFNRTDGALEKRVQAYSSYTFATEINKTYEMNVWYYSKYKNARLSLYVPTTQMPYQTDAINDFSYVGDGYSCGATQLAGTFKYLLNDVAQWQTGTYSMYTTSKRSFDVSGDKSGWTKLSIIFTTDSNTNCVKNATVSLGARTYNDNGINYTAGSVYFTDVSVKIYDNYTINNNKLAGNVTVNDNNNDYIKNRVVISSTSSTALFGTPITLKADPYDGFIFNGWYKGTDTTPISQGEEYTTFYTGNVTYQAKYSYDTSVSNLFLNDFENLSNSTDIENTGSNNLGVWKLLSNYADGRAIGDYISWGSYIATNGAAYNNITPHSGTKMMAAYGRYNTSFRTLTVSPNINYILSFYYYQPTATGNVLNYAAVTTNNNNIKVGTNSERIIYPSDFLAYNYTSISANATWRKYTLTFNSGSNTTLKLFLNYASPNTNYTGYLYLDDFSLLPINTVDSTNTTVLPISNSSAALSTTFKGISSTVYHAYTYMNDSYGRNYTDEMATYEFDRLKDSGIKTVRTIFKSQWAWNSITNSWDWNSQRMNDFYEWAEAMQDRGITIALNAGWHLNYLVDGTASIPEVSHLYADGDYDLACSRYAEWITEALEACTSRSINNIKYLICFTEPSYAISGTPEGGYAAQWVEACNALDTALTSAGIRNNYKIVGPNQAPGYNNSGLLAYALDPLRGNADSSIDIYSSHYYPTSASITNDVYGSLCSSTFTNYMNVMSSYNSAKDFWADEYFASASDSKLGADSAWAGTQTCAGMTSAMNAGIDGVVSWQELDQLWVDMTGSSGEFLDGIHNVGTAPSLFVSAVPKKQYYALTLMSKYMGYQNGTTYTATSPSGSGLYIGAVHLDDGSWSVMVVNTSSIAQKFQTTFATAINQILYRHLYDPSTVAPDARAKIIGADKVYTNVTTSFCDTIPSGGVAIYTGLDF